MCSFLSSGITCGPKNFDVGHQTHFLKGAGTVRSEDKTSYQLDS